MTGSATMDNTALNEMMDVFVLQRAWHSISQCRSHLDAELGAPLIAAIIGHREFAEYVVTVCLTGMPPDQAVWHVATLLVEQPHSDNSISDAFTAIRDEATSPCGQSPDRPRHSQDQTLFGSLAKVC